MPSVVVGGLVSVISAAATAKTIAIGFAVAAKAFVAGAVLSFAASELTKRAQKKPSVPGLSGGGGVTGSTRDLTGSTIPARWVVGRARVSGGIVWLREYGDGNRFAMVQVLSAGACDGIESVWVRGEEVPMERMDNVLTPRRDYEDGKYWGSRAVSHTETVTERVWVGFSGDGDGPPGRTRPTGGGDYVDSDTGPGFEGAGPGDSGRDPSDGEAFGGRAGGPTTVTDGRMLGDDDGRAMRGLRWAGRFPLVVANAAQTPLVSVYRGVVEWLGGGDDVRAQGEGGGRVETRPSRPARAGYVWRTRQRTVTRQVPVPLVKITEYLSADGTGGEAVRALASGGSDGDNDLAWDESHRLEGLSYVLVEFYQEDYTEIDDRFWQTVPSMEYLLRGIKIQYPLNADGDLSEPTWTDNAAIIRWWYMTERRNIPPAAIDFTHFEAARRLCDTDLQLTSATRYRADYPESVKRYTINGSINSGDSAASLDTQLDFAWQGFVVEHGGRFLFRPGADLPSRFTITEDDIIADPIVRPFGSRSDLANELSVSIEQSSGEDYLPENFVVVDATAQAEDGERLPQELTELKFVNSPVQAINFLHQRLRQQRGLVSLELQVKSPPDWRYHELIASDKVEVVIPEHGIGVEGARLRYFRVTGVQVNDNLSVQLNLLEWPDNLYDDQFDFPPRSPKFSYARRNLPSPTGRGYMDWNVAQGGEVIWTAFLSWDATPYETVISYAADGVTGRSVTTRENSAAVDLTQAGRYTFTLYHRSLAGAASPASQVVLDATYAEIPLPRPVVSEARQNGNTILFVLENAPNRDIAGLEVRYMSVGLDGSFADIPLLTEENWESASQMNVSPVTTARGRDDNLFAQALLPASGTYRIHVRWRNRVGNLSPLSDSVTARYEIAAVATGSRASQPLWSGMRERVLLWTHDGEARLYAEGPMRDAVTYDGWDGAGDNALFPFGDHVGRGVALATTGDKTTYTTPLYDDLELATRECYVAIESVAPEGIDGSDPPGYEITLRVGRNESVENHVVADGVVMRYTSVESLQAVVNWYDSRNRVLTAVTVGWRELED